MYTILNNKWVQWQKEPLKQLQIFIIIHILVYGKVNKKLLLLKLFSHKSIQNKTNNMNVLNKKIKQIMKFSNKEYLLMVKKYIY